MVDIVNFQIQPHRPISQRQSLVHRDHHQSPPKLQEPLLTQDGRPAKFLKVTSSYVCHTPWRRPQPSKTSLRWTCPRSHWSPDKQWWDHWKLIKGNQKIVQSFNKQFSNHLLPPRLFNIRPSKKVINPSENLARLFQLTVENTLSETKVIFFLQNNIFGFTF